MSIYHVPGAVLDPEKQVLICSSQYPWKQETLTKLPKILTGSGGTSTGKFWVLCVEGF